MEGREKIQQLLKEGKINSDQAVMLLNALKESEQRREKIFKQVLSQKQKRQQDIRGFFGGWGMAILCLLTVLLLVGNNQNLSRDINKALGYFQQANAPLKEGDYEAARPLIYKGLMKAPHFPLGHTLLGITCMIQYEKNHDETLKTEALQAFQRAAELESTFQRRTKMNTNALFFLFIFILFVAGVLSVIVMGLYNVLVRNEEKVSETWAQLDTYYDKKLDLIPALLDAVKNYSQHEKDTLEKVIQARAAGIQRTQTAEALSASPVQVKQAQQADEQLTAGLRKIFALSERYPELKANVNFLTLQEQLEETEDQIVKARGIYNRQVNGYNAAVRTFPSNLISALFKFQPKGYFETKNN